ncbi:MAG: copper ion binding protein [Thermodesulfobacteriota bacterium]|nr:copper ion binding protein [Thermodesulfobacteriota bacterium]
MKTVKIKGMSCHHCVKAVIRALEEIDGIKDVRVDLKKGEASFDQSKQVDFEDIKERIEKAGYEVA